MEVETAPMEVDTAPKDHVSELSLDNGDEEHRVKGEEELCRKSSSPESSKDGNADEDSEMSEEENEDSEAENDGSSETAEQESLASQKDLASAWKESGNQYYRAQNYRKAAEEYSRAIEADPMVAGLYLNRAAAYLMLKDFQRTVADCDKAIELDQSSSKAYFRKAKALAAKGNFEGALSCYQMGLIREPDAVAVRKERDDLKLLQDKAQVIQKLIDQKSLARALAFLDQILSTATHANTFKILKLQVLVQLNKYEDAYAYSSELIKQDVSDRSLLFLRARSLYFMGNFEGAIKHLQQALRGDPDNREAQAELKRVRILSRQKTEGDDAFKAKNYEMAIEAWSKCLDLDPSNSDLNCKLLSNRANAYSKLRKYAQAIGDCTAALNLNTNFNKATLRRAECYLALGGEENIELALRDLRSLAEGTDNREEQRDYQKRVHQAEQALKQAKRKDYYKILGLQKDCNEEEIKKAYRKQALKYHPDRHTNKSEEEMKQAEKMFKDVAEAYEVLTDAQKKQRYDSGVDIEDLDSPHAGHGGMHSGGMGGIDPEVLFQMFMGGHGGRGGGGFGGMGGMPGGVRFNYG